jgi:hypothetical protein
MPFWEQPTPALADWEEPQANAISLNGNRPAVNRAAPSGNLDDLSCKYSVNLVITS